MFKIFLMILFAISINADLINGVAIIVKDSPITLLDIKKEMKLTGLNAKEVTDILIRKKLEELERKKRKIKVNSDEIYNELKKTAKKNNLTLSEFYDVIRNSTGMTSGELKEKIKEKLLSQKLYSAIAYSFISTPSEDEIKDYYELHKDSFIHPSAFSVVAYTSKDKIKLQQKVENPMLYIPEVQTDEQLLFYDKITPQLAIILNKTKLNHFSEVIYNNRNGFTSFYLKEIKSIKKNSLENVRNQIINMIIAEKQEQTLSAYFARLKSNTNIKFIRTDDNYVK